MYWFFGWPYGRGKLDPQAPEWNLVKVMRCANGVITVRDGSSWYEGEGWDGMFCKAAHPPPPKMFLKDAGIKRGS